MVSIELNNQEFQLKYDVNAVCALEDKAGKGISALLKEDSAGFSVIRLFIWGGIRHINANLRIETVGIWLNTEINKGIEIGYFTERFIKALIESGLLGKNLQLDEGELIPVEMEQTKEN